MVEKNVEFEKCGNVECNNETPNKIGTKIVELQNYIDGTGICLCNECWIELYPENIQE